MTILTARTCHFAAQDLVARPIRDVAEDPATEEAIWRQDRPHPALRRFTACLPAPTAAMPRPG